MSCADWHMPALAHAHTSQGLVTRQPHDCYNKACVPSVSFFEPRSGSSCLCFQPDAALLSCIQRTSHTSEASTSDYPSDIVFQLQPIPPDASTPTTDPQPGESISSRFLVVFESFLSRFALRLENDLKTTESEIDQKTTRNRLAGRWVGGGGRCVGGNGL